jgi:hypothetical protein
MSQGFVLLLSVYCCSTYHCMPIMSLLVPISLGCFYSSRACGTEILISLLVIILKVYDGLYCKLCDAVGSLQAHAEDAL